MTAHSTTQQELVEEARDALDEGHYPLRFFNDPSIYEMELERLFGNTWVFIGHESEIPNPGDYARRYIGQDTFIFVRDESGDVNLLFDSCRHRGTKVCRAEQGNTSHFRCPYHGWTYKNDGTLIGVPQKDIAFQSLDREEHSLHHVPRLDSYEGLVFASLAEDGPSLEEHLGDYKWYLDIQLKLAEGGMEVIGEPHRWIIDANWKTIADNFNGDSYHTAWAHGSIVDLELGGDETVGSAGTGESLDRHIHCDGHTTSLRMMDDEDIYLTYPEEVWDLFDHGDLSDDQLEVARQSLSFTGSIFPNFGFLHFGDTTDNPNEDVAPFFTIRKWRPLGPEKMELWSWGLAPKQAPDHVKERMYKIYTSNFGPTGNFEQDDVPIWSSITDMAQSQMARKQDLQLNYQMGMEWMSHVEYDEEWAGPGTAYAENLEEGGMRLFHEQWFEALAQNEPVATRSARADGGCSSCGSCSETEMEDDR
jgi:PAH dioxygenase large subunit